MSANEVVARLTDAMLEASVVGSFSSLGARLRPRLFDWSTLPDQHGRRIMVTGASSGIGRATALVLAGAGASLWVVGRDPERTEDTAHEARRAGANGAVPVVLDLTDAADVLGFTQRFTHDHERLDALVHAAGALSPVYTTTPDGTERTVATALLAPFRLTWQLSGALRRADRSDLVIVSSGGMYTERFDLAELEMGPDHYRGTTAYARAKRAQVVLAHEWARRWAGDGVASYACHPGWVDTPGLREGLPGFARLTPLLRTPAEGADTVAWLAAGAARSGDSKNPAVDGFFHDRRPRGEYHLPWTRRSPSDAMEDGRRLWDWCAERTGLAGTELPDPARAL